MYSFCSISGTIDATGVTVTLTGSFSSESARCMISRGMVAENSSVCRGRGNWLAIRRIGSIKPMSSIRSASSSTKMLTSFSVTIRCSIRSISRPGVATMMSTPRWIAFTWWCWLTPPKITACESPACRP